MFEYPLVSDVTLSGGTYIENDTLNSQRIDQYRQGTSPMSEVLNSAVVYAYGSSDDYGAKNFPVLFQTQGMGRKKGYQSYDNNIKQYLLGKPKRSSKIAKTIYGDDKRVGANSEPFYVYMVDNHFTMGEIIVKGTLARNYQIQLLTKGERDGSSWKFKAMIFGKDAFIPGSALRAGSVWGDGVYKVSQENSRGNVNRTYTPFAVYNTLSTIRQSINVAGNSAKKKMNFTLNIAGASYTMYYDWEKRLTELQWNALKEQDLLMSKATKENLGQTVSNYDVNSLEPVLSGNGLIGQIPKTNFLSYTKMTERKLDVFLTNVMSIAGTLTTESNAVIDIMGGFDLLQNINRALAKSLSMSPVIQSSDLYVRNGKNGLQYGSYFTEYKHISGVVFRFTHHNFFDQSALADTCERNPYTGNSILSSEGIIMNFGKVSFSGEKGGAPTEANNIEYMYEEGREYIEKAVTGMAHIPGYDGPFAATDVDASSLQMMCTQGIHCYSPLSMGYIQFNMR